MSNRIDLSNINLPEDDANKPADIVTDQNVGDEGVITDPNESKKVETKPDDTTTTQDEPKDEVNKKDEVIAKPGDDGNKVDEKFPEFHKHPDWIKMQEKAKKAEELENKLAHMQGQVDAMLKSKEITTEEKKEARKSAEDRIQEDLQNGWAPKTQLEIVNRSMKYLREELVEAQKEEETKKLSEKQTFETEQKEFTASVENVVETLKINDDGQRKVFEQITAWQEKGILPKNLTKQNVGGAIEHAYDYLSSKGLIASTTPTAPKVEAKKSVEEKKDVNSRISRTSSTGGSNNMSTGKRPVNQLRRSLDQIVLDHAAELG